MSVNFNSINLENFVQSAKNNRAKSPDALPFVTNCRISLQSTPAKNQQDTYSNIKSFLNKDAFKFNDKNIPIKTVMLAVLDAVAFGVFTIITCVFISDTIKTGKTKKAAKTMVKEGEALLEFAQRKIGEVTELFTQKAQTTIDGRKIEVKDNIITEFSKDGKKIVRTSIFDKNNLPYAIREFTEDSTEKFNSIDKISGGYLYQEGVEKLPNNDTRTIKSIFFTKDETGKTSIIFKKDILKQKTKEFVHEKLFRADITKKEGYYQTDFTKDKGKSAKRGVEEYICNKFGKWQKITNAINVPETPDYIEESRMALAEALAELLS